tara:strand:+ start:182 stop:502 length:321 start_codon:yes stop_codon:yes gene_type:complete
MKVEMSKELWNAVIVAIDCDLDDYHSMGTGECPSLDVRYGKMLQARGIIREPQFNVRGDQDLKDVFSVEDLKNRLAQVGLPFEEVESGSDGVICLCFATDDGDYNE